MATQETRTDQIEAAGVRSAEEPRSSGRFAVAGRWARRYWKLSWAWRFNLAILVLAVSSTAAIQITDALGRDQAVMMARGVYYGVVLVWTVGAGVQLFLLFKQSFTAPISQPSSDAGSEAEQNKAQ